jgi:hypothetical protein
MKNLIITGIAMLALTVANAQHLKEAEVPATVKAAFVKKYPTSKVEVWEKEGADYEAEFHLNKVESSAVFTADGTFKEFEQEIKTALLPKTAMEYCTKNYIDYKIEEAAKITDAVGKVMYEAEMKKGKEHFDAMFDDKGNFISKGKTEVGDEEKD